MTEWEIKYKVKTEEGYMMTYCPHCVEHFWPFGSIRRHTDPPCTYTVRLFDGNNILGFDESDSRYEAILVRLR